MTGDILRFDPDRRTNARMIADVARLGLINESMLTLDATWGLGAWWRDWAPDRLVALDLDPAKARDVRADFRRLPFRDAAFDLVCFDPPYAYRGTSRHTMDGQYGLGEYRSPADVDRLLVAGLCEAARVVKPGGVVIVKCQDQVVSGRPRMQSHTATGVAEGHAGCRLLSVFEVAGGVRKQRSQRTVRNNTSQALVFTRSMARRKDAA